MAALMAVRFTQLLLWITRAECRWAHGPTQRTNTVAALLMLDNGRSAEFRMVQGALIQEIQQLSRLAVRLEGQLLARRRRVWFIHTSLYGIPPARFVERHDQPR